MPHKRCCWSFHDDLCDDCHPRFAGFSLPLSLMLVIRCGVPAWLLLQLSTDIALVLVLCWGLWGSGLQHAHHGWLAGVWAAVEEEESLGSMELVSANAPLISLAPVCGFAMNLKTPSVHFVFQIIDSCRCRSIC
jgi:hypothetical protein